MASVREKGFTVVELLIVIVILVIAIIALLPGSRAGWIDVPARVIEAMPTTGSASALGFGYSADVTAEGDREFVVSGAGAGLSVVCQTAGRCKFSKQ